MSYLVSRFFYLLLVYTNSNAEWVHSADASTILIGETFNGNYRGFFNSLTFNNVSITTDGSTDPVNINFYIIGDDVTSNNNNISSFITYLQSNQCSQQSNQPAQLNDQIDIFYRCGFGITPGTNITLIFEFTSKYLIWMLNYNKLTWILEISQPQNTQFSIFIQTEPFRNFNNKHFYVNTALTNIQTSNTANFVYSISYDCTSCSSLVDGPSLWDIDLINVNNSYNWHFAQEFYPNELDIANLTSFHIDMKCTFQFILIPHLFGLSSTDEFTPTSFYNYFTATESWPEPHFYGSNGLNIIQSTNTSSLFWTPKVLQIAGIDLTEKDYYVWTLSLHTVLNQGGICLFQRTVGPQSIEYITGDSMQMTIPNLNSVLLNNYQDFLIIMEGGPFPLTNSPTKLPSETPTMFPTTTTTTFEIMYTTDDNIYQVVLTVLMEYVGDIMTNDIYVIQTLVINLLNENVVGIIADKLIVSVSFDTKQETITISIDAELITEQAADDMIAYAEDTLISNLWTALLGNNELEITINDIDVETDKEVRQRDEVGASKQDKTIFENNLILFIIIFCAIICCIVMGISLILVRRRKNKQIIEKAIQIAPIDSPIQAYAEGPGSAASDVYMNQLPMTGIVHVVPGSSNECNMVSNPVMITGSLPQPPQRIMAEHNDESNINEQPLHERKETNVMMEGAGEGVNFTGTTAAVGDYDINHVRQSSIDDVHNLPPPPLPPSKVELCGDVDVYDDPQNDDEVSDDGLARPLTSKGGDIIVSDDEQLVQEVNTMGQ